MPSYLQVLDNIDHLSSGVGVGDLALFSHGPQLTEGGHQFLQSGVRYTWPVLLEHLQLSLRLWIVHSVATENITCAQDIGLQSGASRDHFLSWRVLLLFYWGCLACRENVWHAAV